VAPVLMTGDRGHTSRATRTGGSYAYPGSFRLSPDEQDIAQLAFCRLKGRLGPRPHRGIGLKASPRENRRQRRTATGPSPQPGKFLTRAARPAV